MEYNQPDNVQLDPNTGQYYTEQTYAPPQNMYGGYNTMGGYQGGYQGGGIAGMYGNNNYGMPRTTRTNTGDRSMVWEQMQNRQPYQYNAPSVAQMFPSMSMPSQQYTGGAGQFLNGLLGNVAMPKPVSTVAVK